MKQTERNAQICAAFIAGATCQAIADEHGITRQRVNQITRRAGLTKRRVAMYENKETE
jgi:DNA-binding CsgD family transcriptional regulator